jgi:hypothetical protein
MENGINKKDASESMIKHLNENLSEQQRAKKGKNENTFLFEYISLYLI